MQEILGQGKYYLIAGMEIFLESHSRTWLQAQAVNGKPAQRCCGCVPHLKHLADGKMISSFQSSVIHILHCLI